MGVVRRLAKQPATTEHASDAHADQRRDAVNILGRGLGQKAEARLSGVRIGREYSVDHDSWT